MWFSLFVQASLPSHHEPATPKYPKSYDKLVDSIGYTAVGNSTGGYKVGVRGSDGIEIVVEFHADGENLDRLTNHLKALPVDLARFSEDKKDLARLIWYHNAIVWGHRVLRAAGLITALVLLIKYGENAIDNAFVLEVVLNLFGSITNVGLKWLEGKERRITGERHKIDERLADLLTEYPNESPNKIAFLTLFKRFFGYKTFREWASELPRVSGHTDLKTGVQETALILPVGGSKGNSFPITVEDTKVEFFNGKSPYAFRFPRESMFNVRALLESFELVDAYRGDKKRAQEVVSRVDDVGVFADVMGASVGGVVYVRHNYFASLMVTMGANLFCLVSELINTYGLEPRVEKTAEQREPIDEYVSSILERQQDPAIAKKMFEVILAVTRYPWTVFMGKFPRTANVVINNGLLGYGPTA